MKTKKMIEAGVPPTCVGTAVECVKAAVTAGRCASEKTAAALLDWVLADPKHSSRKNDPCFGPLALALENDRMTAASEALRDTPAPCSAWGEQDSDVVSQMSVICSIPVAVRGALMPDSHLGYSMPIGGVLACDNAVVPYAVGIDIACRMKLSVLEPSTRERKTECLREDSVRALSKGTVFGTGKGHERPKEHAVNDDPTWQSTKFLKSLKDKAVAQLGSSGEGNHFVSIVMIEAFEDTNHLGMKNGETRVGILSHSRSRGAGAAVAERFARIAMDTKKHLPNAAKKLAWLSMNGEAGREYWEAMELMGRYAAACHDVIHREVARELGFEIETSVENHHNFAWMEEVGGKNCIVHRKGATPAGLGTVGVIPGTMADVGFVVVGLGEERSMMSASHGAGRAMSRKKAISSLSRREMAAKLEASGVTLIGGGIDEAPGAYKDIRKVMKDQSDLVRSIASFFPFVVRMADPNDRKGQTWSKSRRRSSPK